MRPRTAGLIVFIFLWSMSTHGKPSSSGDEPYYLLVSQSLIADRDFDLANNFADDDGRRVGADGLQPGAHVKLTRRGSLWSIHDIGLSVLVLPAYVAGSAMAAAIPESTLARFRMSRGRFAYSIASMFMVALTAFAAMLFNAALLSSSAVFTRWRASVVTLCVFLSPPVMAHGFLIFPEVPAVLVVCAVVWLALKPQAEVTRGRALAVVVGLGFTPWVHRKFSFFVLGLLFVLWRYHGDWLVTQPRRAKLWLAAAFVVPQAALHLITLAVWGRIGGPVSAAGIFDIHGIGTGALGLLLDRSRGLIGYGPIYALLPVIWWAAGREHRRWLIPAALLFVPVAAFISWDAGYSPAARYLVPLMPLLALPAAAALEHRWIRLVAIVPLLLQIFISCYSWGHPRALWPGEVGENRVLNAIPVVGSALNRLLPVVNHGSWR